VSQRFCGAVRSASAGACTGGLGNLPIRGPYSGDEHRDPDNRPFHLSKVRLGLHSHARAYPRKEDRPLRLHRLQERGSRVVRHLGLYSLAASRHEVAATKGDKALTPKGTRNPNLRGEPAQKRRTAAERSDEHFAIGHRHHGRALRDRVRVALTSTGTKKPPLALDQRRLSREWHTSCLVNFMSDTARYLLFLLITGCLGACFIRVFWEGEQARTSGRKGVKADRRRE
jgi:hypothetical protein